MYDLYVIKVFSDKTYSKVIYTTKPFIPKQIIKVMNQLLADFPNHYTRIEKIRVCFYVKCVLI